MSAFEAPVLFDGPRYFALAKPSGLLVHRGWDRDDVVATDIARAHVGGSGVVYPAHRLDRPTSGVLLFARDAEAAAALGQLFEERRARKRYLALVRGVPAGAFVVDHPVPRTEGGERVPAVSVFRTLGSVGRYGWLEAWPRSGRFHQLRRHLKHVSHPIIGDVNYGKSEHNKLWRAQAGLARLALHAESLRFECPFGAGPVCIRAPLPDDLRLPLERFGFDAAVISRGEEGFDPDSLASPAAP